MKIKWNAVITLHKRAIFEYMVFTPSLTCRLSPADSTDNEGSQKKWMCCHGGLPWWFIFFGWLLVIATSVVAGYFTMLYGLKFGKDRSISWLVSMIVSFFQSVLIIQPLKVRSPFPPSGRTLHLTNFSNMFYKALISVFIINLSTEIIFYEHIIAVENVHIHLYSYLLPQVVCLAVFFALVMKKVDEDFQNVAFVENDRNLGKC